MLFTETRRGQFDCGVSVYSVKNSLFLLSDPLFAPAVQLYSLVPGILLYLF